MSPDLQRGGRAGFTLTELMIAVAILAVVVAAVMQSFVVQNRAYTVVDQVVEAQQNMRAVAWLIERDLRMSGFMVPEGAAVCAIDRTGGPDTLWVTDSDAIDPTNQTRPALGATVQNYLSATGVQSITVDSTVLDGSPYYDSNGDGIADTDFQRNGGVILVNVDEPGQGVACGTVVADPTPTTLRVDFATAIPPAPPTDRVVAVPAHIYAIEPDPATGAPRLTRNGMFLASDVEDLQVAFFFDLDRDGVVDAAPVHENPGAAGAAPYDAGAWDNRDLREVRLNLVVRTRDADREIATGREQATENRVATVASDGFRRRVHTSTVRLRNVGFRGVVL